MGHEQRRAREPLSAGLADHFEQVVQSFAARHRDRVQLAALPGLVQRRGIEIGPVAVVALGIFDRRSALAQCLAQVLAPACSPEYHHALETHDRERRQLQQPFAVVAVLRRYDPGDAMGFERPHATAAYRGDPEPRRKLAAGADQLHRALDRIGADEDGVVELVEPVDQVHERVQVLDIADLDRGKQDGTAARVLDHAGKRLRLGRRPRHHDAFSRQRFH
ncbi:hypothetical protein D3C83_04900 [compost metagenome]